MWRPLRYVSQFGQTVRYDRVRRTQPINPIWMPSIFDVGFTMDLHAEGVRLERGLILPLFLDHLYKRYKQSRRQCRHSCGTSYYPSKADQKVGEMGDMVASYGPNAN